MKPFAKALAGVVASAGIVFMGSTAVAEGYVMYEAGASASPATLALRGVPLRDAAEKVAAHGAIEVRIAEDLANDSVSLVTAGELAGAHLVPVFSSVLLSLGYTVAMEDGHLVVSKPAAGSDLDITLDPAELQEAFGNIGSDALVILMPRMVMDDDGKALGLTGNLGALPATSLLGLQDGDILHKLNGVLIDNLMVVMSLAEQFEGDSFNATILRDGAPILINYTIKQ